MNKGWPGALLSSKRMLNGICPSPSNISLSPGLSGGKVSPGKDSLPALSNTTLHSHGGNFPLLELQHLSCYSKICLLLSIFEAS